MLPNNENLPNSFVGEIMRENTPYRFSATKDGFLAVYKVKGQDVNVTCDSSVGKQTISVYGRIV